MLQIVDFIKKQHLNIYHAIELGESKKAYEMMIEHLRYVERLLQESVLDEKSAHIV